MAKKRRGRKGKRGGDESAINAPDILPDVLEKSIESWKVNCQYIFGLVMVVLLLCLAVNHYLMLHEHLNVDIEGKENGEILVDSFYFTTTTMSSVGYGDISPVTSTGKLWIALEQILLILLAFGAMGTIDVCKRI